MGECLRGNCSIHGELYCSFPYLRLVRPQSDSTLAVRAVTAHMSRPFRLIFFRPVFFSSVSCMIEFKICERCSVAWYAVVTDCFKVYSATYQGRRVSISSTGAILGDGVVCPGSFMSTRANFPLPLPPVESAPMPLTCNMRHSSDYCGGSAVGRWTCDLQVAGSIPAAGGFHVT